MNIEEILKDIRSHFTGKKVDDYNYIKERNRELAKEGAPYEVLDAVAKLILEVIDTDYMKNKKEELKKDIKNHESLFTKAENLFKQGNFEQAKVVLDKIIERLGNHFEDDDDFHYVNIEDAFAFQIYANVEYKDRKIIRLVPDHYYKYYYLHGVVCNKLGLKQDAFKSYISALRWFPTSFSVLIEVASLAISDKEYDKALNILKKAWRNCFVPSEIARIYRGLGFYAYNLENYRLAMASYLLSTAFDRNVNVSNELGVIAQKLGQTEFKPLTPQESKEELAKVGFGFGVNGQLLTAAQSLEKQFSERGELTTAHYFQRIVTGLVPNEGNKAKLKEMEDKLQNLQ